MWYFVHFILLPSSTVFALLSFSMSLSRGTFVAAIAGGHIARALSGVFTHGSGRSWREAGRGGMERGERVRSTPLLLISKEVERRRKFSCEKADKSQRAEGGSMANVTSCLPNPRESCRCQKKQRSRYLFASSAQR